MPTRFTYVLMSPERKMMRPVCSFSVAKFVTVTVTFFCPALMMVGLTAKPCVAVSEMSPVRFSELTRNVFVPPVPSMRSVSAEAFSRANAGAYAPVASKLK